MRAELDRVDELLAESERRAGDLPHRERYLLLTRVARPAARARLPRRIDEVERELG